MFQGEQEGQRWVNGDEKSGVGGNRVDTFGSYGKDFGWYYESAAKLLEGLH